MIEGSDSTLSQEVMMPAVLKRMQLSVTKGRYIRGSRAIHRRRNHKQVMTTRLLLLRHGTPLRQTERGVRTDTTPRFAGLGRHSTHGSRQREARAVVAWTVVVWR